MAARRVRKRGRSWLALVLLAILVVAVVIVWRRAAGVEGERALAELSDRRLALEAERARLEAQIRELESRGRIAEIAERQLGMHVASGPQYVMIPRRLSPPQ